MKKCILSFTIVFVLLFNSFFTNIVYANEYVPLVTPTSQLLETSKYLAPMLAPFAPEIALIAGITISAGIVYQNREQVITLAGGLYKDLISAGYAVTKVGIDGFNLAADALNYLNTQIGNVVANHNLSIPYALSAGESITLPITSINGITLPASKITLGLTDGATIYDLRTYDLSVPSTLSVNDLSKWEVEVLVGGGLCFSWILNTYKLKITSYNDESICLNPTFPSDILANPTAIPYQPGQTMRIPADIPFTSGIPSGGDWVGDMVGTKDWTSTFPTVDTPTVDPPSDELDVPTTETGFWGSILGWLAKLLDGILGIPAAIAAALASLIAFFIIDWDLVFQAMDYSAVWQSHFKPFYDITGALTNISASPNNSGGKFYMIIPREMGGSGTLQCVLDYTVGGVYVTWARTFIGWAIWLAFGWWILELFKPKININ